MSDEFHKRLRKLGVVRGARSLKKSNPIKNHENEESSGTAADPLIELGDTGEEQPIEKLLPGGQIAHNELGSYFVVDGVYPQKHVHGDRSLGELLQYERIPFPDFFGDERLNVLGPKDFLFLDTETTGLWGAAVFAFMIGAAFFDGDALVVRQYFSRDQSEEPAMLYALAEKLKSLKGLITFNGRNFDVPLLDNRYYINRLDNLVGDMREQPHIDLLHPARRLWRQRLGSCSLGSLEKNLLSIRRTHEDVPGWSIPGIYMDYLRSGDAREIARVFYHNHIDMLSMVTLAEHVLTIISDQQKDAHPLDMRSLAKWQISLGYSETAESTLVMALETGKGQEKYIENELRYDLGMLLRKMDRRHEAAEHWQRIVEEYEPAAQAPLAFSATIELAKYYEWHEKDLVQARRWTMEAKSLIDQGNLVAGIQHEAVIHRLARIERKLELGSPS